jgi:hypothetical protein
MSEDDFASLALTGDRHTVAHAAIRSGARVIDGRDRGVWVKRRKLPPPLRQYQIP